MEILETISTSCEKCIFAEFNGKGKQISCKANMLNKLANNGAIIDDSNQYFLIKNRYCVYCRHTDYWPNDLSIEQSLEKVNKENEIQVSVLLLFQLGDTLVDLKTSVECLKKQAITPKQIHIITNTGFSYSDITNIVGNIKNLSIEYVVDDINIDLMVFYGTKKLYFTNTLILEAGKKISDDYLTKINRRIKVDMERWPIIMCPDQYHGLFTLTTLIPHLQDYIDKLENKKLILDMRDI